MRENDTINTTPQQESENENNNKRCKPRKGIIDEEHIRVNSIKQYSEKRRIIQFMKELRRNGCCINLDSPKKTETTVTPDNLVTLLLKQVKNTPKNN